MATFDRPSRSTGTRARAGLWLAALLIMASPGVQSSAGAEAGGPPLAGWMQGFEPAAEPPPLPEAGFVDEDGATVALADFSGRVVLVNFWATWCGPCLREMPSLDRLAAALGGEGLTVVALSQDRGGWERIAPYRDRLGLRHLRLLHDPGSRFMYGVGVRGLPTSVLVGRDGRELGRLAGPAEWDAPEAVELVRHYLRRGR